MQTAPILLPRFMLSLSITKKTHNDSRNIDVVLSLMGKMEKGPDLIVIGWFGGRVGEYTKTMKGRSVSQASQLERISGPRPFLPSHGHENHCGVRS